MARRLRMSTTSTTKTLYIYSLLYLFTQVVCYIQYTYHFSNVKQIISYKKKYKNTFNNHQSASTSHEIYHNNEYKYNPQHLFFKSINHTLQDSQHWINLPKLWVNCPRTKSIKLRLMYQITIQHTLLTFDMPLIDCWLNLRNP